MSFSFTKDDVRKHLVSLGYKNLSDEQLLEFCTDLKRLIRYEEKQKRIEAHVEFRKRHKEYQQRLELRHQRRPRSADSTYSSGTGSDASGGGGGPNHDKTSPRLKKTVHQHHEKKEMVYDRKSGNLDITKESMVTMATVSYEDDGEGPSSSASLVQESRRATFRQSQVAVAPRPRRRHQSSKQQQQSSNQLSSSSSVSTSAASLSQELVKVNINLSAAVAEGDDKTAKKTRERPDFDGGCFELLHKPCGESMTKQILPPRPEIPTKPTTSCIMPKFKEQTNKPRDANRDPVQLHAYYQKHWSKLRLPGDGSDKQLRWAVREWMMGQPK